MCECLSVVLYLWREKKYTTHRVYDQTFIDTHTQSLYTIANSTVTSAQTFCTNNTFIGRSWRWRSITQFLNKTTRVDLILWYPPIHSRACLPFIKMKNTHYFQDHILIKTEMINSITSQMRLDELSLLSVCGSMNCSRLRFHSCLAVLGAPELPERAMFS